MTEERSCKTCRFHFGNSKLGVICGDKFIGACNSFDKWQPIQKAPSFQMTEDQAYEICRIISGSNNWDEDLKRLKQAGYIRKSSLVELVEEAEWIYENYQSAKYCLTTDEALEKNHDALQALKKDHPEFGGKK